MNQSEMLQLIFEKLVSLEQGQASIKEEIQENRQAIRELQVEVQGNGHAIKELQKDVQEIKQGMRFYDHKIVEHEKEIFKLKS
ncbi:hypothetical protein [Ammoniphilus sp. YIM 78166]|uniref:hypothetical protein n=1 Tax=Ammoniphilus sp. YIM 78166 TaxID=1644106 RepID=UPI00106FB44C|nr:hypothetical protein [Ammoniphilus sp. YIM 78166]